MALAGLVDIMTAVADQVRAVVLAGAPDVDVQVESRMVLNPTPPTVDVYPGDLARDSATAGFEDLDGAYILTVRARVSTADTNAGQDLLLAFMDDTDTLSLAAAITDDPTLNGYASSVQVRDQTGYRIFEHPSGEGAYLGFQLTALVIAGES